MNQLQDLWPFPKASLQSPYCATVCHSGKLGAKCTLWIGLISRCQAFAKQPQSLMVSLRCGLTHSTQWNRENCLQFPDSFTQYVKQCVHLLKATLSQAFPQWQLSFLSTGSAGSWWPSGGEWVRWSEGEHMIRWKHFQRFRFSCSLWLTDIVQLLMPNCLREMFNLELPNCSHQIYPTES